MSQSAPIYKATYSGVPVFEMTCNNVAVMRRQSDGYLNATQILKVADFDKPQRTRILEREVQTGLHEKVQGGYGKYQGTWVPFERGVALAKHYHVDTILRPIFDFTKGDTSPPLAPKHITAASTRPRKPRSTPTAESSTKKKKFVMKHMARDASMEFDRYRQHNKNNNHDTFSISSNQDFSHVNPPLHPPPFNLYENDKKRRLDQLNELDNDDDDDQEGTEEDEADGLLVGSTNNSNSISNIDRSYAQKLLQYFISDDSGIPAILLHPPLDLDVNVIIDDEGHTSLHWAAAVGRLKLVSILIDLGADIYRVNYKGQTALMRSVLFTNNFDAKSFIALIDMLKKTIFNIDKEDQTVFHHVAATASWKGKVHASRYYMECLIEQLSSNQSELISILNVQDVCGDTALSIAARIGNKKLVKLLMDAGASPEISNEKGMSAQAYLSELERSHRFQQQSTTTGVLHSPNMSVSEMIENSGALQPYGELRTGRYEHKNESGSRQRLRQNVEGLFSKIVIHDRSQPSIVPHMFDGFAGNYERELIQKEHMIKEKKSELDLAQKRLLGTQHTAEQIQFDSSKLNQVEQSSKELAELLKAQTLNIQKETIFQLIADKEEKQQQEEEVEEQGYESLLTELKHLQQKRKKRTEQLMELRLQTPSKRHQEYKRLISMCCNVSYENVDLMLLPLLSSFDELGIPAASTDDFTNASINITSPTL